MIEIADLWAGYGGLDILRGVDLNVQEGSINCIVGPNGAGKSTVLKTISGLLSPRRGSIVVAGVDLTGQAPTAVLRAGVVQVPQRHGLFAGLSVRQNVLMGGYLIRRQRKRLDRRYETLAELFPPLADRPNVPAGSLSGGQRRMVEFARAMMLDPAVVLLDEPTLGLDPNSLTIIRGSIEAMKQAGKTILMVEQNVRFGLALADHATVMSAGRVVLSGPASELADQPSLMEVFFGSDTEASGADASPAERLHVPDGV
jgi:branched-chain amino acid transport system ATP-binding protein